MQNKAKNLMHTSSESELSSTVISENYQWIAESAYYKALARRFSPHRDQEDWLEAKKDYADMLSKQQRNGLVWLVCDKMTTTSCSNEPTYSETLPSE